MTKNYDSLSIATNENDSETVFTLHWRPIDENKCSMDIFNDLVWRVAFFLYIFFFLLHSSIFSHHFFFLLFLQLVNQMSAMRERESDKELSEMRWKEFNETNWKKTKSLKKQRKKDVQLIVWIFILFFFDVEKWKLWVVKKAKEKIQTNFTFWVN